MKLQKQKALLIIIALGIVIALPGCKDDNATSNKVPEGRVSTSVPESVISEENSLLSIIKNMKKVKVSEVPDMKQDAEVIIQHRYKQTNKKPYIILDKDLWEYEFVFTGKEMTKPGQLAGSWIDFSEDMTYTYGYYNEVQGKGRYTFNLDTGLLLLIDDSDDVKPQEFEAKLFDKSMIMDGNEIYRDNNYNAKLRRITEIPSKI